MLRKLRKRPYPEKSYPTEMWSGLQRDNSHCLHICFTVVCRFVEFIMSESLKNILLLVLKILLGAMFCFAAVLKIIGIDQFEMYVFSFGIFSLNASFMLARLCIAWELILGIALIVNVYNRLFIRLAMLTLVGFSVFLVYLIAIGRNDNCHCFGEFIKFTPWQSLVKNVLFIVIVALVSKVKSFRFRPHWALVLLTMLVPVVAVFCVSPPDNFLFGEGGGNGIVSQELFDKYVSDNESFVETGVLEGKKIVCYFSVSCRYCQLTARKISAMAERLSVPDTAVFYIFRGEYRTSQADKFFAKTGTKPFRYTFIGSDTLNPMTHGIVPVITFTENGNIQKTFDYRNITESSVSEFFAAPEH